jgi:hypothetical protein
MQALSFTGCTFTGRTELILRTIKQIDVTGISQK